MYFKGVSLEYDMHVVASQSAGSNRIIFGGLSIAVADFLCR